VYSGSIMAKQTLYNSNLGSKERINQLLQVSADDLETLERCGPGEVYLYKTLSQILSFNATILYLYLYFCLFISSNLPAYEFLPDPYDIQVCCLVGLKGTKTGDTLVKDAGPLKSYTLEGIHIYPYTHIPIYPYTHITIHPYTHIPIHP
jgi:translation elongation factor EF-G